MFTIADVIGIKLISSNCLLAGVGDKLIHYFNDEKGKTISKIITLNLKNKIIGIHSEAIDDLNERHLVAVYGGRELAIFELFRNELTKVQNLVFNDFISNVCLYICDDHQLNSVEFCVLSSHSVAYCLGTKSENRKRWRILNRSACEDKSVLYSSFLLGKQWSKTTCFGGTAFGDLFIWTIQDKCSDCEVLQRITCHNGVIFSIHCLLRHNILTTSSDDRSVKVWNLDFPKDDPNNWQNCSITSTKSLYGHTARIFRHKIILNDNQPHIVSIGEDSNACIWSIDGKLLYRQSVSDGATLWNLDYCAKRKCLLIGTSDGNIAQIFIDRVLNNSLYSVANLCDVKSSANSIDSNENFSKIRIMPYGELIVGLTGHNKLYYQTVKNGISNENWSHIEQLLDGNQKISLLEIKHDLVAVVAFQTIAVARWNKETSSFHKLFSWHFFKRLIRSLKFIEKHEFIACDDVGNCQLVSITSSKTLSFTLPVCKERWITAALRYMENLLLSDRCGNLHLYSINEEKEEIRFHHTLKNVHGYMGCNTINVENPHSTDNEDYISTSGHDGTIKIIKIDNENRTLKINLAQKIPILWSDKIIPFKNDPSDRLIAGFNAKHFVFWHKNTNFTFEYECGGGHRFWDVYVDFTDYLCRFYFLRHKKIHEVTFAMPNQVQQPPLFQINQCNWHTKPCNTVECILTSGNDLLFISGGDDNLLKFNKLINDKNDLSSMQFPMHLNDMISHISNITTIFSMKQINAKNESYLIFSAGGRAQICVTQIQMFTDHAPPRIEELCNFMLRGDMMTRKRLDRKQNIIFDPETKFTSLCAYEGAHLNEIVLVVGCSDGYIRQFKYFQNKITLIDAIFYGRCILNIFHFKWKSQNYLLTMTTDGKICFWSLENFTSSSVPFFELRHHDSGINSFAFMKIDENGRFFIATGGDDQAIVITQLLFDENNVSVINTKRFAYEHTAQVNGMKFCMDKLCLYTFSVDQVILCINLKTFLIQKVAKSCISDAKGLQLINQNRILVYGCGAELINVE